MFNDDAMDALCRHQFDALVSDLDQFAEFVVDRAVRAGGFVFQADIDEGKGYFFFPVLETVTPAHPFARVSFEIGGVCLCDPTFRTLPSCYERYPIWDLGDIFREQDSRLAPVATRSVYHAHR